MCPNCVRKVRSRVDGPIILHAGTRADNQSFRRLATANLGRYARGLLGMLEALAEEPALALDTESDSLYRYFYKVCLVQVSTPSTDYLVDPLRLPDISGLNDLLADPSIEKVVHAAENDVVVLKRDFGFSFAHIFDTMVAARILGLAPREPGGLAGRKLRGQVGQARPVNRLGSPPAHRSSS